MKNFIYIILIGLLIGCASTAKQLANSNDDQVVIQNEELDYEIIIIEPGFNAWLPTQRPIHQFSLSQLRQRNIRFVISWNQRVQQAFNYPPNLYDMPINYDPQTDYGIEVNYKLFMYFTYFQQKYKQRL